MTVSQNYGNRDHTSNRIGVLSDKNPVRVLMGKLIPELLITSLHQIVYLISSTLVHDSMAWIIWHTLTFVKDLHEESKRASLQSLYTTGKAQVQGNKIARMQTQQKKLTIVPPHVPQIYLWSPDLFIYYRGLLWSVCMGKHHSVTSLQYIHEPVGRNSRENPPEACLKTAL